MNKTKKLNNVIQFPRVSKSAQKIITIYEFHNSLYNFLLDVGAVSNIEQYRCFVFVERKNINYFIEKWIYLKF